MLIIGFMDFWGNLFKKGSVLKSMLPEKMKRQQERSIF